MFVVILPVRTLVGLVWVLHCVLCLIYFVILLDTRLPVIRWVKLSLNFDFHAVSSLHVALNIINLNYLNNGL